MWCLVTWFSDRLGSVRLTDDLDNLGGFPKLFYDSKVGEGQFCN